MKVQNISFGRSIPLAMCNIQNKKNDAPVCSILSEIDCKDVSDYKKLRETPNVWQFRSSFYRHMKRKNELLQDLAANKIKKSELGVADRAYLNLRYYKVETLNSDLACISSIQEDYKNNALNVDFIVSPGKEKYKYAGKVMLAAMGKKVLRENGEMLCIKNPTESALPFYINKCGFREKSDYLLYMNRDDLEKFIKTVEAETYSPIIDFTS